MGKDSKIEWTDHTFNPWIGCTKVSDGCKYCYAEALDKRQLWDNKTHWGPNASRRRTSESYWKQPTAWDREAERKQKRHKVFCASLADVFEDHPQIQKEGWRIKLWHLIEQTPNLDWLLLTKRPGNVMDFVPELWKHGHWAQNAWLGVSVENQEAADERREGFRLAPATVKFVSYEPALGPVDWRSWFECPACAGSGEIYAPTGLDETFEDFDFQPCGACGGNKYDPIIDWLICGGESGPNARPMHPDWARMARDQCQAAGVPFFFKQWGAWKEIQFDKRDRGDILFSPINGIIERLPDPLIRGNAQEFKRTIAMSRVGKKAAGRILDGREWNQMPNLKV